MNVLLVGAGVIGTVYGVQLGAGGHTVAVLEHGARTREIVRRGLVALDLTGPMSKSAETHVVPDAGGGPYDLVLVALRADCVGSATASLRALSGAPVLLFFGNNPRGRTALPADLPGTVHVGFPGIGGSIRNGTAEYMRIAQQPTMLESGGGRAIDEFATTLSRAGFVVRRTTDMEGWLAYHAVFVASISAALYRRHGNATELANDSATLTLMCRSIEEGFRALRREGVRGVPRNLRTLHLAVLRPFAVRYWSRTMRAPTGETLFAAHSRHAEPEMRELAAEVLDRVAGARGTNHLRRLLSDA